jgi:hypothetical protein
MKKVIDEQKLSLKSIRENEPNPLMSFKVRTQSGRSILFELTFSTNSCKLVNS